MNANSPWLKGGNAAKTSRPETAAKTNAIDIFVGLLIMRILLASSLEC